MKEIPYDAAIRKGDTVSGVMLTTIRYYDFEDKDPLAIILRDAKAHCATHYMPLPKAKGRYAAMTNEAVANE